MRENEKQKRDGSGQKRAADRGGENSRSGEKRKVRRPESGTSARGSRERVPLDPAARREMEARKAEVRERRQRKEMERRRLSGTNQEIKITCAALIAIFVLVIGYLAYFIVKDAEIYRNSSYNSKRQALLAEHYSRGDITASDGTVLATTETDSDGNDVRVYPYDSEYAHVVGYTVNGVTGLEASAGSYLLDSHENIVNQVIADLTGDRVTGDTVRTTLDTELQKVAYDALGDNDGAVIVMEPSTGKILAMVSKPDFDPNTLDSEYDSLDEGTLVNRVTQGLYTPGSTFKILTALEYLRENPNSWSKFSYDCDGILTEGDYTIRCYQRESHGEEDLEKAFAESCNGAFATIGGTLNFRKFYDLCESVGYNSSLGGVLSVNRSSFTLNNSNSLWNVFQTSIGQGETQVTPILNCMIVSAIANDGVMMKPQLLDAVLNKDGFKLQSFSSSAYDTVMSEKEAAQLQTFMKACCDYGTGKSASGSGYTAYGKTGSAETGTDVDTNAWFVGYAESDSDSSRQVAVSIVVEEAGSGGSIAAPIAQQIFEAAFN